MQKTAQSVLLRNSTTEADTEHHSASQVQSTYFNTDYPFPPYNFCSFLSLPF